MAQPNSTRQIERVYEAEVPVMYANSVELGISVYDVSLTLGQTLRADPTRAKVHQFARVVMSPQHAKVLAGLLIKHLMEYEANFGTIPAGEEGTATISIEQVSEQSPDDARDSESET